MQHNVGALLTSWMNNMKRRRRTPEEPHEPQNNTPETHLVEGSRIFGSLRIAGSLRIDGHVEGEIKAENTIVVGERAVVEAPLTANSVLIAGQVTGNVTARHSVKIQSPGMLAGDVTTARLEIEDGVEFYGYCSTEREDANRPLLLVPSIGSRPLRLAAHFGRLLPPEE
jgi:cytoskeletal protein CcmA (bactofilin family)